MSGPRLVGALANHPAAAAFAAEVQRVHRRYALEAVGAFGLCPHVGARGDEPDADRHVDSAFGTFVVFLDRDPPHDSVVAIATELGTSVSHLVFPLVDGDPAAFERFANRFLDELRSRVSPAPVMAVFHPKMSGDAAAPHRLVGILRHAPDPFIQLVPEGLHTGGTVFAERIDEYVADHSQRNFERVRGPTLERLRILLDDVRADRDRSYAPHLARLADPPAR